MSALLNAASSRMVQQVLLEIGRSSARLVALTAPDRQAGVSFFARHIAGMASAGGIRTLLFTSSPSEALEAYERQAGAQLNVADLRTAFQDGASFVDVLYMSQFVENLFAEYQLIVLDLPPLLEGAGINAAAVAAQSDLAYLVCRLGQTPRRRLTSALSLARQSGASLHAILANSYGHRTPGAEIASALLRFHHLAPRFTTWAARQAAEAAILN